MRRLLPLLAAAALAACTRGGGTAASPSPAPTPSAAPSASGAASRPAAGSAAPRATTPPVHVVTHGQNGKNVTITETRGGRTVYDVSALASEAQTGPAGATARLDHPHIVFHDPQRHTTIADAPEATITERDKSVLMIGGVQARSQAGAVLTCDRLRYDGATEKFHGDGNVVLRSPGGMSLTGTKIDGDLRLENVRVTGGPTP